MAFNFQFTEWLSLLLKCPSSLDGWMCILVCTEMHIQVGWASFWNLQGWMCILVCTKMHIQGWKMTVFYGWAWMCMDEPGCAWMYLDVRFSMCLFYILTVIRADSKSPFLNLANDFLTLLGLFWHPFWTIIIKNCIVFNYETHSLVYNLI